MEKKFTGGEVGTYFDIWRDKMITDRDRINFLQHITEGYGGGWLLRLSGHGRGWRLHETSQPGADPDIREAIDKIMKKTVVNVEEKS